MSFHLSPLKGRIVRMFFQKCFNFFLGKNDGFGNRLEGNRFSRSNLSDAEFFNTVKPQPPALLVRQAGIVTGHQQITKLLALPFLPVGEEHFFRRFADGNAFRQLLKRESVIGFHMTRLFGVVVVFIRPAFPAQKLLLAGKDLAGKADDPSVRVQVDDGLFVLFIQHEYVFVLEHSYVPPFRFF